MRIEVQPVETDMDPTDNLGTASMRITGQGWDNGYSVMAADEDSITGEVGSSEPFVSSVALVRVIPEVVSAISISLSALPRYRVRSRDDTMDGISHS